MNRRRAGILVFPEVEVLDFCGPFEVFSVTRPEEDRRSLDPSPYEVLIIAEHPSVVVATGGLKVVPDHTFDDCPALDVLVVPGGWGTRREMLNDRLIAWLEERARQVTTLTSVCTGSLLLGKAGLLDGKRATTHWRVLEEMRRLFPAVNAIDDQHVVEDGDVITSAGISRASIWRCGWSPGITAMRLLGRPPGTWSTLSRRTTAGGFDRLQNQTSCWIAACQVRNMCRTRESLTRSMIPYLILPRSVPTVPGNSRRVKWGRRA